MNSWELCITFWVDITFQGGKNLENMISRTKLIHYLSLVMCLERKYVSTFLERVWTAHSDHVITSMTLDQLSFVLCMCFDRSLASQKSWYRYVILLFLIGSVRTLFPTQIYMYLSFRFILYEMCQTPSGFANIPKSCYDTHVSWW